MIIKNESELNILKQGGKILADVLNIVSKEVNPGVSAWDLNQIAEQEIKKRGAQPAFKNYKSGQYNPPYPAALCVSVNDEVVHGIPTKEKILEGGSIVGLDLGIKYEGLFTDAAITMPVGKVEQKWLKLIQVTEQSLANALTQIRAGVKTGDIGFAIQSTVEAAKFSAVKELVGHGVGRAVHEEPDIPCYGKPGQGTKLVEGLVIAVEPMINAGGWKVTQDDDGWTMRTADGSRSAHFEHTVVVTKNGCEIVTKQ